MKTQLHGFWRCTIMNGTVKYWEGRTPGQEYYEPVDPYRNHPVCGFDLKELSHYAKKVGKPIAELSYAEISQFAS